jgi:hypothetical protein
MIITRTWENVNLLSLFSKLQGDIHHNLVSIIMDTNPLVAHVCVVKVITMKYNPKTSSFNDVDLIKEQRKNLNRNSCNSSSHNFIINCHSNCIKR